MQQLIDGHRHFLQNIFPERRDHYHLLAEGQSPKALFITCSDSRIVPDLMLNTEPGDLFIIRNAGNIIPPEGPLAIGGVAATIEYAVEVIKVQHVIVCGHSDCGAIKAALDHVALEQLPKAKIWLEHVEDASKFKQPLNPSEGSQAELAALIRGNVIAQLHNLRTQPAILHALSEQRVQLHAWYYDIMTGHIERYDEAAKRFVNLVD